jgi:homogentisate 1,2-dioxygenase
MAFMFESHRAFLPTDHALATAALQDDYDSCWRGFPKADLPK